MKPFSLSKAVVCLAFSLLALSACAGNSDSRTEAAVNKMNSDLKQSLAELRLAPESPLTKTQADAAGITTWEYNLGTVVYDAKCAAKVLEPYKAKLSGAIYGDLSSKASLAYAWQFAGLRDFEGLSKEEAATVVGQYVQCGQSAFDSYARSMGEQGWEMVSYNRFSYTSPGGQFGTFTPAVSVDYGYDIMWKRPKTTK